MRIAVWHNLGAGGAKRYLAQHVKGLVDCGHEVESWCLSTADERYLPLSSWVKEHVVRFDGAFLLPQTPWGKAFHYYHYLRACFCAAEKAYEQCATEINAGHFDICLTANCRIMGVPSLGRFLRIPSVLYIQEPNRCQYEAMPDSIWLAPQNILGRGRWSGLKASMKDWARIRRERLALRIEIDSAEGYDALLVNSYFSRESILRAYGRDAQVCYPGVDTAFFYDRNLAREPFVLGVGSFTWHKNIPFCLEALRLMPPPRPPLVWIGNGGSRRRAEELREYAVALGVEFRPFYDVSDEELAAYYNRAKAMIFCPRLEPFGLAPLEANACGLPVAGIKEGGLRETICNGVNGLLVEPTREAVAQGLMLLISTEEWPSWSARARRHVEQSWSLKDSVARLEKQLKQVLDQVRFSVAR